MKRAEAHLDPALQPMRDQVLILKHNLNARAVAGLKGEVAIAEANRFIANLEDEPGQ